MQEEILNSWINFIDLERLEKTKLNPAVINTKTFFNFDNINEQIDIISLNFRNFDGLIESLKKDFPIEKDAEGNDQNPLYLYFPLIRTQEQGAEAIYPLFAIDITYQKHEFYSSGKVYVLPYKEADYIPLIAAFRRFLGASEDDFLENLPLNQIIGRLTGQHYNTFEESFSALKHYITKNLITGTLHDHDCLLGYANMEDHCRKLREELSLLQQTNLDNSALATRYLFQVENEEPQQELDNNDLWRGAFHDNQPLTKGQGDLLRRLNKGDDLLAVQAGPGTGKTALFMSIIANRIVERAIHLADTGQDQNNLMVIVSTSNKAVENVLEQFRNDKKLKDLNNFYFIGGKHTNISASLPRLEKYITELKTKEFDPDRHEAVRLKLLKTVDTLENIKTNYSHLEEELHNKQNTGASLYGGGAPETWQTWLNTQTDHFLEHIFQIGYSSESKELKEIEFWLTNQLSEIELYKEEFKSTQKKYPLVNIDLLVSDSLDLQPAIDDLHLLSSKMTILPFWQLETIFKKKTELFLAWIMQYEALLKNVLKDFYQLTYKDIPQLISMFNILRHDVSSLQAKKPGKDIEAKDLQKLIKHTKHYDKEHEDLELLLEEYQRIKKEMTSYEQPTFADYYRLQTIKEQHQLYELSMTYLNEEMVRRKKELISTLRDWTDLITNHNGRWITKKWAELGIEHHFSLISLAYPVLTSTLASYNNFFKEFFYLWKEKQLTVNRIKNEKPVHLVLSDESGMAGVHSLFPLLYKSEKAIVVGDPLQLEPTVQVGSHQAYAYERANYQTALLAGQYSPVSVTAYHRAAGCKTGKFDDRGEGLILDEHRRCQPDIADLFIDVANYPELKIKTAPLKGAAKERLERFGGKNLVFYDIEGEKGEWRNTNNHEVTSIGRILDKLGAAGYQLNKDVCIITPFKSQELLLIKNFGQRLHHTFQSAKIGTVHKFQGIEFDVVIFSPVIFSPKDSSWFLNAKPNFINVAVSRARHLFITCGNFQALSATGGYLEKLCQHHQEYGYLLEGTPDDHVENREQDTTIGYLDDCAHLLYFKDVLQNVQQELVIISPYLGTSQYHFQQLNWIIDAMARNVKVLVYYGWKKNDNNEEAIRQYKKVLGDNLIRIDQFTHEKCIIQDRREMAIGSFNWLSHRYGEYCQLEDNKWNRATIRRESSVVVRDNTIIEKVLHGLT